MSNDKNHQDNTMPELTMPYILQKLEQIASNTAYLHEAIAALQVIASGNSGDCGSPGDIASQAKAEALGQAVKSREETNRQLITLYTKMYEDIQSPQSLSDSVMKWQELRHIAQAAFDNCDGEVIAPFLQKIVESL